jgi:hypothetical protein
MEQAGKATGFFRDGEIPDLKGGRRFLTSNSPNPYQKREGKTET